MTTPTESLRTYLDALAEYDFTAAWGMLCSEAQRQRPLGIYLDIMNALPVGRMPDRTYSDEVVTDGSASVTVTWMAPDPEGLLDLGKRVTPEEFSRRMRTGNIPVRPRPEVFELSLENGVWKILKAFTD
jgi:hypothetical protein